MLTRLGLFVAALLLLPLLARLLAGAPPDWSALAPMPSAPLAWTLMVAVILPALADWRGPRLLGVQRGYYLALAVAGALLGLTVGSVWPGSGLLWPAPLLLLAGLQGLWHESSIFDGLAQGGWGRVLTAALAGLIVGNLLTFAFVLGGGHLIVQVPPVFAQFGFVLFGLLCLQLSDVIAEAWRGKTRAELFPRKPFPISVVAKK